MVFCGAAIISGAGNARNLATDFPRNKAENPRLQFVNECFDLTSGESKWTFEKSLTVMSTCFTPDGKEVVVLHKLPDQRGWFLDDRNALKTAPIPRG
jgi:hypothetical protein